MAMELSGDTITAMRTAALELLESLNAETLERISYPFEDEKERRSWYYTPTDHGGVRLGEMSSVQQQLAFKLLATGLSAGGYATAVLIMSTENILDRLDGWMAPQDGRRSRDPMFYQLSVFGHPDHQPWGWRFGGHHLSMHYTISSEFVSVTPNFFGVDPSISPLIGGYSFRPLAGLEDLARVLVRTLDDGQLGRAVISDVAPTDIVTANRPRVSPGDRPVHITETLRVPPSPPMSSYMSEFEAKTIAEIGLRDEHLAKLEFCRTPTGLAASEMTSKQRELLEMLLDQYLGRMPDELAMRERDRVARTNQDLHFAWAGGFVSGDPHYYRIQGPRLLVEYDNLHRGGCHVHSVWRDPAGDFGDDILGRHIAQDH
jgi:hypothetical protein